MYQGLHEAVLLMQMDNGYCDEAGATTALHKLEAEALKPISEAPLAWVTEADAWCKANHGAVLETACTGQDKGLCTRTQCYVFWSCACGDVHVPPHVYTVLTWLFDNM